ncbi:MAG: IPT/TIG domain-containing protein, partial [Candidatus Rokubacteria bacterium]|nr:IPT/TIG domain-containing protein [Candidatus Rokubacteria bacterium]
MLRQGRFSGLGVTVLTLLALVCLLAGPVGAATISYTYDAGGRLVSVSDPSGDTVRYYYDAVGNLLDIARWPTTQLALIEFTPNSGPATTTVTISGTGFSPTAALNVVKFNGVAATVSAATALQLVVKVPAGATTGPISVGVGASTASSREAFTVTANSGVPTV